MSMHEYYKEDYDPPEFAIEDDDSEHRALMRVAGVSYRQKEIELCCKVGSTVRFVAEPTNKFDPHALRVEVLLNTPPQNKKFIWIHIGYIPKDHTLAVKQAIARDDFSEAVIRLLGKPQNVDIIGVQLALYFTDKAPDLYGGLQAC